MIPQDRTRTVWTFFGLTQEQYSRHPLYIQDTLRAAKSEIEGLRATLANAEGIKPLNSTEAFRRPGMHIETDEGTYVFPFQPRWGCVRGSMTMVLPAADGDWHKRLEVSYNSDDSRDEQVVEIMAGLHGCSISPRASNVFEIKLND